MPYELPIKYDATFFCAHCNCYVTHQCTAYKDAEYRHCTKCGESTTWVPGTDKRLGSTPDTSQHDDARWQEDVDFKRNSDRHYRPRDKRSKR